MLCIHDTSFRNREGKGSVSREAKGAALSGCSRKEYRCKYTFTQVGERQKERDRNRERERQSPLKCMAGFSSLEGRSRPLLTLDRPTAPGYDVPQPTSNAQCVTSPTPSRRYCSVFATPQNISNDCSSGANRLTVTMSWLSMGCFRMELRRIYLFFYDRNNEIFIFLSIIVLKLKWILKGEK